MSETKDWRKICAACNEGEPPKDCEYYGEPNGCNSPTYGKHPTCDKSSQGGDMAAMREALEEFVKYSELVQRMGIFVRDSLVKITTKAREALSAPPRNIDRINNYSDMVDAWNNYIRTYHGTIDGFFAWLFDKAKGAAT